MAPTTKRCMCLNEMVLLVVVLLLQGLASGATSQHNAGTSRPDSKSASRGGAGRTRFDPDASGDRMPSLFSTDEAQYDRYAACLAATEGLRRLRDKELAEGGKKGPSRWSSADESAGNDAAERARAQYVIQSGEVLKALGMSVSQFNQMGRQISRDKEMKEKVMEQAYLYRMAATLDMERVPLIEDPESEKMLKATKKKRVEMFCESMSEIEQLRADQIKKLKRSLHVEKLPESVKISDPAVMPLLSPKVRAVVEAFPLQAEEIVKKYGLHSDEFNQMLEETRSNPMFRWKVQKYMKHRDPKDETKPKQPF